MVKYEDFRSNKGKSKGLVELCKDLGVQLPVKIKLDDIPH
ncbi:unnamed protein product, partial [Didymodactylos carnosus]